MKNSKNDYLFLVEKRVQELIHFTNIINLESISKLGLVPRHELDSRSINYGSNDMLRFDGMGHVNLSITNPNIDFLYKCRKHNPESEFVILGLDPAFLKELDSSKYDFISTNFGSKKARLCNVEMLFLGDRAHLDTNVPTDNQSEIIVKETISVKFIKRIYFNSQNKVEYIKRLFPNVEVIVTDVMHKYKGQKADTKEQVSNSSELFELIKNTTEKIKIASYNNKENVNHDNNLNIVRKRAYEYYLGNWFADTKSYELSQDILRDINIEQHFDTFAFKRELIGMFQDEGNFPGKASWKINFNTSIIKEINLEANQIAALSVMEKIFNRGSITCLSKNVEEYIVKTYSDEKQHHLIDYVYKIQSILIELVKQGALKNGERVFFDKLDADLSVVLLNDLIELDTYVSKLYNSTPLFDCLQIENNNPDLSISIGTYGPKVVTIIEDCKEIHKRDFISVNSKPVLNPTKEIMDYVLNYIFGFKTFRENQLDAIIKILNGDDAIVLLPTGSGKSIIYQLSALLLPGMTIIIDPIVSLANDQVENLKRQGVNRVINLDSKTQNAKEVLEDIATGQYNMIFVTPERFQNPKFRNQMRYFCDTRLAPLVAIDEAHCVSEWGHDFRTAYLSIANTCRKICRTREGISPVIVGLTGTASFSVLRDMQRDLGILEKDVIRPTSFNRKELNFRVVKTEPKYKEKVLEDIITSELPDYFGELYSDFYINKGLNSNCGIIFSLYAGEKNHETFGTRKMQNRINSMFGAKVCGAYNGQMIHEEKQTDATDFKRNKLIALSATKSYGMGIDKPNIRWSIHTSIPMSVEAFYQEVGRCARDGKKSVSWLILSNTNLERNRKLLDVNATSLDVLKHEGGRSNDDIGKAMYLYLNSFVGIDMEISTLQEIIRSIVLGETQFGFSNASKAELEKSIYRLIIIGYLSDYTVDHASGIIVVEKAQYSTEKIIKTYREYISGYQDDDGYLDNQIAYLLSATSKVVDDEAMFVLKTVETLLREFIYKVIEEGKRNALKNMLEYAHDASQFIDLEQGGEVLRTRIIEYLSTSETFDINEIINNATDFKILNKVAKKIRSQKQANATIPQFQRVLESYPEHIGVHYLIAMMSAKTHNASQFTDSLEAYLKYGVESYSLNPGHLYRTLINNMSVMKLSDDEANKLVQVISRNVGWDYVEEVMKKIDSSHLDVIYLLNAINNIDTANV